MSLDPELADAPEHPDAIAWEIRHCADRLDSLAELAWTFAPLQVYESLHQAAADARLAAKELGGMP